MARARIRPYLSPTLSLLALDWPDGASRDDFLGFAISRSPGFRGESQSWLPNRVGFDGPAPRGTDLPSHTSPIQKFLWWDARIDDEDRGRTFEYAVTPVVGPKDDPRLLTSHAGNVNATIPLPEEKGIGTYFNRAVVSSQAFSNKFRGALDEDRLALALTWLGNGMEGIIPGFVADAPEVEGAIYHCTDERWVRKALAEMGGRASLVYNKTRKDDQNAALVDFFAGRDSLSFLPRTKAAIMHNKFLVRIKNGKPAAVLMGSANFTTGGLTTQANVIHTFESPKLARLYLERKQLLEDDPPIAKTAADAGWSDRIKVGDAKIRVFFPPEPKGDRESLKAIVRAVRKAKSSVLFCLFSPTDSELREAIFQVGDEGKMMFGLVNKIPRRVEEGEEATDAGAVARVAIYHRSRDNRDVFAHELYPRARHPEGFWWEVSSLPGQSSKWPVYIHHKFVIIDAETDQPTIYTGSANMSNNALYRNDENLLEITDCPRLAAIYLAEFLRLYEHYRARAIFQRMRAGTYTLRPNSSWAAKYYRKGSPEYKSRVNMARS